MLIFWNSGKAIHIYPSSDKQYVTIASKEILIKTLYDHYTKNTKDTIINDIKFILYISYFVNVQNMKGSYGVFFVNV